MSVRNGAKLLLGWTVAWVIAGAVIGALFATHDTGHVGAIGTLIILCGAGLVFGITSGVIFIFACVALPLSWLPARIAIGVVIGAFAGIVGIYAADLLVGIVDRFVIGSIVSGITALMSSIVFARTTNRPSQWRTRAS